MDSSILGSIVSFCKKFNFRSKRSRTSPHLGIADMQAIQNTFLASCVFQRSLKITLSSVPCLVARSFNCIRHIFGMLPVVNPVMLHRYQATINLIQNRKPTIIINLLSISPLATTQVKFNLQRKIYLHN